MSNNTEDVVLATGANRLVLREHHDPHYWEIVAASGTVVEHRTSWIRVKDTWVKRVGAEDSEIDLENMRCHGTIDGIRNILQNVDLVHPISKATLLTRLIETVIKKALKADNHRGDAIELNKIITNLHGEAIMAERLLSLSSTKDE